MATYYGKNATLVNAQNGASKIQSGEHVGRVRCLFEAIDLSTQSLADQDLVYVGGKLQAGARVLEAVVSSPVDLGGSGTVDVGWLANVQDAADDDGFIAAGDTSGQVAKVVMAAGAPGLGKKFESETQVTLTSNGAVTAGAGKVIYVWLYYVLD